MSTNRRRIESPSDGRTYTLSRNAKGHVFITTTSSTGRTHTLRLLPDFVLTFCNELVDLIESTDE